jgi:hypothetical protein
MDDTSSGVQGHRSIVELQHFIHAIRDSGYKGTSNAIAELIDNAIEASATEVDIHVVQQSDVPYPISIHVSDNGTGMSPETLEIALAFGGSTRFNSRTGLGRYGMGLPNSSVNQARRVEVVTWLQKEEYWWCYLDVDEIASGKRKRLPEVKRVAKVPDQLDVSHDHGTLVSWKKCDRLSYRRFSKLVSALRYDIGRIFRHHLWAGRVIRINSTPVRTIDPLFQQEGEGLVGAINYGSTIEYEIRIPIESLHQQTSRVQVRFVELPIDKWHKLSNKEKQGYGISKRAGMSILRANREVDYGWFFMGNKRKENYDDWWRGELNFQPELDELFGISHTKQGIRATEDIKRILSPEIERIAHALNSRVRVCYFSIRRKDKKQPSEQVAEERDSIFPPPNIKEKNTKIMLEEHKDNFQTKGAKGLSFKLLPQVIENMNLFVPEKNEFEIKIYLNTDHPFYHKLYYPLKMNDKAIIPTLTVSLELILLALARAEFQYSGKNYRKSVKIFRETWSEILAAFIQ